MGEMLKDSWETYATSLANCRWKFHDYAYTVDNLRYISGDVSNWEIVFINTILTLKYSIRFEANGVFIYCTSI